MHPLLLEALAACEVELGPAEGGRRARLGDLTTRQVVEHAIKPWTQECQMSLVQALLTGESLKGRLVCPGGAAGRPLCRMSRQTYVHR